MHAYVQTRVFRRSRISVSGKPFLDGKAVAATTQNGKSTVGPTDGERLGHRPLPAHRAAETQSPKDWHRPAMPRHPNATDVCFESRARPLDFRLSHVGGGGDRVLFHSGHPIRPRQLTGSTGGALGCPRSLRSAARLIGRGFRNQSVDQRAGEPAPREASPRSEALEADD